MPASQSGYFNLQTFTSAGDLAEAYRLYTYVSGTTTHKIVYTEPTATTAHTYTNDGLGGQFIATNARGELPAPLYLTAGTYDLTLKTPAGATVWTRAAKGVEDLATANDAALRAELSAADDNAEGAGMIGYGYTETYAADTVGAKLRERISVKDFGAVGDGTADDTTALQAARDFVAANATRYTMIFPSGIYKYSASPNWAISNASILAEGEVRLRYTGTENAVLLDGGAAGFIWNCHFGTQANPFLIEAPATAKNGVYARSYHHSSAWINVRGCGPLYAGLRVEFSVVSVYGVTVSGNEATWYTSAKPGNGIYLTERGAGEKVAACTFFNPIIEDVAADGIVLVNADKNLFINGTSEGNAAGWGLTITSTCLFNHFDGLDMETNATGDVSDSGVGTIYSHIISDSLFQTNAGSRSIQVYGGQCDAIVHNGAGLALNRVEYGSGGGAITGTGTGLSKHGVLPTGGSLDEERQPYSLHASASIATATPTTLITLPSVGTRNYIITACSPGAGNAAAYSAWAMVAQDLGTSRILTQVDGSGLTITKSGQNIIITQTSGGAITVVARANPA